MNLIFKIWWLRRNFKIFSCAVLSHLVMSNSLQPNDLQPARHLCLSEFFRQEYRSGLPYLPPGDLHLTWKQWLWIWTFTLHENITRIFISRAEQIIIYYKSISIFKDLQAFLKLNSEKVLPSCDFSKDPKDWNEYCTLDRLLEKVFHF